MSEHDLASTSRHVAIIGAGLAGLTAASVLLENRHEVTVIDKGRGVGGRLATRRIGDATLDHGAQFFTVRGEAFGEVIAEAVDEGVVEIWCRGFGDEDGYPRFRGTRGMNAFAKWLAARVTSAGGTILTDMRADAVAGSEFGWMIELADNEPLGADDVIITAPVPQALALVDNGGVELDANTRRELEAISYKPTLALLLTLDGPSGLKPPGGVQRTEDDLFTFIADNHHKGLSASSSMTFHVNGDVSAARWDDDDEAVIHDLIATAQPWLGGAAIEEAQLKKWKFAGPLVAHPDPCVTLRREPGRLVIAGDAFAGPKVEGAFNSGRAAGEMVSSR